MNRLRLTRAREDVESLFSTLGSLRETRLTAVLGYLVARFPGNFGPLLGFRPSPADEISVEETKKGERYDVLIRQCGVTLIIEGKVVGGAIGRRTRWGPLSPPSSSPT